MQAFYSPERLLRLCDLVLQRLLGLRPADFEVGLAGWCDCGMFSWLV